MLDLIRHSHQRWTGNGKVLKVEIVKGTGMGFDEEALKAVRQFRFQPAKKDGKNIASELTYIYRFRLER